jgi:hypothetical protein
VTGGECSRQPPSPTRPAERSSWVDADELVLHEKAEEGAERRELAAYGCLAGSLP